MSKIVFILLYGLVTHGAFAQAPPPTQGVPFLRLVWSRIADLNGELGSVECAEFSPDGRLVATATKNSNDMSVWRVSDGTLLWSKKADQEVERIAFSPDGTLLAAGGEDDQLRLFNPADGKLLLTLAHTSGIDSLRWSPRGHLLATGEESGIVRLWQMPEGKQVGQGKANGAINELDFTNDGNLLVAAGDRTGIHVFHTSDMRVAKLIHRNGSAPTIAVRLSPDNRIVAGAGHEGIVDIWSLHDGEHIRRVNFTGRKIETLTFSPDGHYLLYAGHDPHIRVVRLSDGALVHQSEPVDWVWMRGDPHLNKRLHNTLMETQAEEDARKQQSR
jgi:WD40 repeat protein